MVSKDQSIGGLIFTVCTTIAIAYTFAMFWPALDTIRIWIIAIPVLIGFLAILAIGAWIGWTMATTPPPKPIEDLPLEEPVERETMKTKKKAEK